MTSSSASLAISASSWSSPRSAARRCAAHARRAGHRRGQRPTLVEELGLQPSRYEGPTGIVGVLHDAFRQAGIPNVSLWSAVPHYVSLAPSPRAARALCDRLGELLGIELDLRSSRRRRRSTRSRSPRPSPRIRGRRVRPELERRADSIEELLDEDDLPTGESLAASCRSSCATARAATLHPRRSRRCAPGRGCAISLLDTGNT